MNEIRSKQETMKTLLSLLFIAIAGLSNAQNAGEIFGKIINDKNEPIVGAIVTTTNNSIVFGAASDVDGNFRISGLNPGKYDLLVVSMGFDSLKVENMWIKSDQLTRVGELQLTETPDGFYGPTIHIVGIKTPLIDINGGTMVSIGADQLKHSPAAHGGNIKNIIGKSLSDIKVGPNGTDLYFRGSRSGSAVYYVDGMKIYGEVPNIPASGLQNISVYTGGVPARYGDSTGGYVVISTKSYLDEYSR